MPPLRSGHAACKILLRILVHLLPPKCGESVPDDEPDLDWFNRPRNPSDPDPDGFDQRPSWQPEEIPLGYGRILVLDDTLRPQPLRSNNRSLKKSWQRGPESYARGE